MTAQPISARNLLRETFANMGSLYAPLLIINSPILIFAVLPIVGNLASLRIINWLWAVTVVFLWGASIFYIYRSLTGNQVTVGEAFKQANRRVPQLILVNIMFVLLVLAGSLLLIIPGFYVLYRLMFSLYAAIIDNSAAVDSLRSSWELTKGRWWLVFRSNLLIFFVAVVPIILISILIVSTGNLQASKLAVNLLRFLVEPLMTVYIVLLYLRLRESTATIK